MLKNTKTLLIASQLTALFLWFSPSTHASISWNEAFLNSETVRQTNFRADDIDKYTEAGYNGTSRSKLYEHVRLPKTTVIHPYNPTGERDEGNNVIIDLRNGHHPILHTFNVRFPTTNSLSVLASHLPRDLICSIITNKIAPESVAVTWATLNQPFKDNVPLLVRPHHNCCPDNDVGTYYLNKKVIIGLFHPNPDFTTMAANMGSTWNLNLGERPHKLSQFDMTIHDGVASPDNMQIGGLGEIEGRTTNSFWTLVINENMAYATLHSMVSDADQNILTQISQVANQVKNLPLFLSAAGFGGQPDNIHLKAINTIFHGRNLYNFDISIPRGINPFLLPDGSEVAISGDNSIWVKQPGGPGYYATPWKDYAIAMNLDFRFVVVDIANLYESCLPMHIQRGAKPFLLSDGSEVAISGDDSIWVKSPTQGHYSTPWQQYANEKNLRFKFFINNQ